MLAYVNSVPPLLGEMGSLRLLVLLAGEPIRPIDPAAWVSHTAAMTGTFPAYGMSPSLSTITSTSSSITSSIPDTEREYSSLPEGPADKV